MVKRLGFVSNSSSSSFVAAISKDTDTVVEFTIKVNILDYVDETIKTLEELDAYELNNYTQYGDDSFTKEKIKWAELIKSGKSIIIGSASNEGTPEEGFLCDMGLNNAAKAHDLIVLEGEGGY
jgi:hypothetical protein